MDPFFPSNDELLKADPGEVAGYIDSGIWELEDYLARRERLRLHLRLSLEDLIEE